jgi:ABC-type uncharacterized transport system permease subunit
MELTLLPLLIAAALRAGTPVLWAALGELLAERAGVLNLGVEGMMLVGALAGFVATQASGQPWAGVVAAAGAGMAMSLVHAFLSVTLRANQVISGLALTIFATGMCGLLGKSYVGSPTPGFVPLPLPLLSDIPIVGSILFQHDALVYLGYLFVPLLWLLLYHTRLGLQIRAVGESPGSADAMGVRVTSLRYGCILAGGMAAGIGGAHLSLAYTQMWIDNMTAGRGWIALAMVIFGAWNPMWTALGAYLFGGVQALQLRLQAFGWQLSPYVLMMAPYVFTLVVLVLASRYARHRHLRTPGALGTPYAREEG